MSEQKTELEKKTVTIHYTFYFSDRNTNGYASYALDFCEEVNTDNDKFKNIQKNLIKMFNEKTGGNYEPISCYQYAELVKAEVNRNILVRAIRWIAKKLRN